MTTPAAECLAAIPLAAGTRLIAPIAFGLQWEVYRAEVFGKATVLLRFMPAPFRAEWKVPGTIAVDTAARYPALAYAISDTLRPFSHNAPMIASDGALWHDAGSSAPLEAMPRDVEGVLQAIDRVSQSLQRLHREGAIHGDVHPDFVDLRLGTRCLIGVGVDVRALGADLGSNDGLGRRGYSPPELWDASGGAPLGPWTDIHALGATLYSCLTGSIPPDFREYRRAPDQISQIVHDAILAAFAPEDRRAACVSDAILWALAPLIHDRPQDVAEWQKALVPDPDTAPTLAPMPSAAKGLAQLTPSTPRRGRILSIASTILLLLGASGYFGYRALPSIRAGIESMIEKERSQDSLKAPKSAPARPPAPATSVAHLPSFDGRWRLAADSDCDEPRWITVNGDSLTMQIGNVTIVEVIVRRDKETNALVTYAPNLDASYDFRPLDGSRLRMTALKQNISEIWIRCD
jgi:hypothetical protein